MLFVDHKSTSGFSVILKEIPGWDGSKAVSFDWFAIGMLRDVSVSPEAKANWDQLMRDRAERREQRQRADHSR